MVDRFQKLIDQSPDAILMDVGGRIVYVNNATVRLFGAASPAEMLGRSRLEFIHPDCHPAVKERIKKLIQDAKPVAALENGFTSMVESLTVNKVIKGK
jgi:PAS domain S-box-containing protein